MTDRARRILLLVGAGLVVWFALVLGVWALRDLHDTVPATMPAPTAQDPAARAGTTVELSCGTLFDPSNPPSPTAPTGIELDREPCDLVIGDARRVLVLDSAVFVLGLVALVLVRRRLPQLAADAPEPVAQR